MPAQPQHERTSYKYNKTRDAVLLTISGVPPLTIYLTEDMIRAAAKHLNEGRTTGEKKPDTTDITLSSIDHNTTI